MGKGDLVTMSLSNTPFSFVFSTKYSLTAVSKYVDLFFCIII